MTLRDPNLVPTNDGSFTFHSTIFNENAHSLSGAKNETLFHYLEGCRIADLKKIQDKVNILEVGFGIGLGFLCTQELFKNTPKKKLNYYALEIDEDLIYYTLKTSLKHLGSPKINKISDDLKLYTLQKENILLTIFLGDATITLTQAIEHCLIEKVDAVYQDAFSPKKCPSLWSLAWFNLVARACKEQTLLSTYSASASVRKALTEAGWIVEEGGAFGTKRSSTRARLSALRNQEN